MIDEKIYEQFEEDYKGNDLTVGQIKKKYDLGAGVYKRYIRVFRERNGYLRTGGHLKPKNIQKLRCGHYRVYKQIDGKFTSCGVYKTKDTAVKVRDLLRQYDWDLTMLSTIQEMVVV